MVFRLPEMDRFAKLLPFAAALVLSACAGYAAQSCRHAGAGYYCVKQGDTLYRIGKRFGVPVDSLKRWNGLSDNHIQAGQTLRVSDGGRVRRVQQKPLPQPYSAPQPVQAAYVPLRMPVTGGTVVRGFGGGSRGMDIAAPQGTPVYAAADGQVIYVGEAVRGYGRLVLVRHSRMLVTAYGNNGSIAVSQNQWVRAGQQLATVGSTGRADGVSALHFEVRDGGTAVDPSRYLR